VKATARVHCQQSEAKMTEVEGNLCGLLWTFNGKLHITVQIMDGSLQVSDKGHA